MELHYADPNAKRISNGCWTCRLRRKKCDERYPICNVCAGLDISCHRSQHKPEWMDGGIRQEEMAAELKREVKARTHRRRGEREVEIQVNSATIENGVAGNPPPEAAQNPLHSAPEFRITEPETLGNATEQSAEAPLQSRFGCPLIRQKLGQSLELERSDTFLLMFYLDHLVLFLFPFYNPPLLQGGRAWMLELMVTSPVVRQAVLCQSSYFFSLVRGTVDESTCWDTVLMQATDALSVLRQSLQVIYDSEVAEHLHGAVRIMTSIMQLQRFETTILASSHWQVHLTGAAGLLKQLLSHQGTTATPHGSNFDVVMRGLGPSLRILPAHCVEIQSPEQAAFRMSSTLLMIDDIIASTMMQEHPKLYEYHYSLLGNINGNEPLIDLAAVMGCQNWVMLQIGEIAVLDAWKLERKRAAALDIIDLVNRATIIKKAIEDNLTQLVSAQFPPLEENKSLLDAFTAEYNGQPKVPPAQNLLVTQVWAHAALLYLLIVLSGWQLANPEVRRHVGQIVELLTREISPPTLLRTMVWPFCVAGCLANEEQELQFRNMAEALQPSAMFGSIYKALEIMKRTWSTRHTDDTLNRDLAACFKCLGNIALLV